MDARRIHAQRSAPSNVQILPQGSQFERARPLVAFARVSRESAYVEGLQVTADYKLAMAAGRDAGNRSARAKGRDFWDNEDKLAAVRAFERVMAAVPKEQRQ